MVPVPEQGLSIWFGQFVFRTLMPVMRRKNIFGNRKTGLADRRASRRFPLRLALKYRSLGPAPSEWIVSESVDISSGGLLFRTQEAVPPGQPIEAWISWPMFLDKHVPLRLATRGAVVRNSAGGCAMRFETYEFRTCHVSEINMRPETHLRNGTSSASF